MELWIEGAMNMSYGAMNRRRQVLVSSGNRDL